VSLQPGDLLSPAQVLGLVPVLSKSELHRALQSGELPSGRRGRRYIIRRVDLEAWVETFFAPATERAPTPPAETPDEILRRIEEGAA